MKPRMRIWLLVSLLCLIGIDIAFTQKNISNLDQNFERYSTLSMDVRSTFMNATRKRGNINLSIPNPYRSASLDLELYRSDVISDNYVYHVAGPNGIETFHGTTTVAMRGNVVGRPGTKANVVVDRDYFFAAIEEENGIITYIEPKKFFDPNADHSEMVVYQNIDVKPMSKSCMGALHTRELKKTENRRPTQGQYRASTCYTVDYAVASDSEYYESVGSSSSAARNRVISVTDLVNTDYDDPAFQNYQLSFSLVEHFVSTSDNTDEWGNNPGNIEEYLNWFTDWGRGSESNDELSSDYDLASLWTGHNLSGTTIGLAWLGVVCGSQFFPYHFNVLENFRTGSSSLDMSNLRALTSHEIGHNFDSGHDSSSGFIMSGSVNSSNPSSTWSSASVSAIEGYVSSRNSCLTSCGGGGGGGGTNPPNADFSWNVTDDCAPGEVRYTDNSTNSPTSWQWTFQGGTPSSSTSQNPIVDYNTPGVYDVSLTVSNSAGSDVITRNNIIVIEEGPLADFTYTINGNTVTFTNTSSNYTSSFWNFGDGNTSNQTNPTHTYASAGSYSVRLEVGGSCGSDARTITITIDGPPNADFYQNINSGCEGVQIYFYDQSTGDPTSWFWEFEGGTPATSTSRNPRITYNEAGIFDVRLTVSNANGSDQQVRTNFINIEGYPLPFFTYSVDGSTVSFQNQSENGQEFAWNFGDGNTSFLSNPVHTYNEGGTYTVTLTAYNECGSDLYSQNIEIVLLPVADFVWEGSTQGCQGHTIQFIDESLNNVTSYQWDFPGGTPSTSTAANPLVTYNQPGVFNVSLTVFNTEGSDQITVNELVTISPDPTALFDVVTVSGQASFTNQSTSSTGYFWQFGDGNTSVLENPNHTYEANGEYTVRLTASNDCSEDVAEEVINIVLPPEAVFQIEGDGTGCIGQAFQMVNLSLNDPDTYSWIAEGADVETSTDANPSFTYSNPGTYSISLTASNASGSDVFTIENIITILPTPEVDFNWITSQLGSGMANTVFTTTTNTPVSYTWQVDAPYTLEGAEPEITWPQDIYAVTLIGENICGSSDITKEVSTYDIPEASFELATENSCISNNIELINTSSENSETFKWIMPGASPATSTDRNPVISYQEIGNYSITLISSNPEGSDTLEIKNAVSILPPPEIDFDVEVADLVASFAATSNTEVTYAWNFGDGTEGTGSNPQHTYPEEAIYTVSLVGSNICGSDVIEKEISTYDIPVAGFTVDAVLPCVDGTINFENTTTANATSWKWSFPGATPSSSEEEHPTVSYPETGSYDVTLIAYNPEGSDTLVVEDAVVILPAPEVDFAVEVVDLVASFAATGNTEVTYVWNFGDETQGEGSNIEHEYNEETIYTVTLVGENVCGGDTVVKAVSTYDIPVAGFTVDAVLPCIDGTINFENTTTANATSWKWSFPGATPSSSEEEHPTVSYPDTGSYDVTLIAYNPAGSDTLVVEDAVVILPAPEVDFAVEVVDLVASFEATGNTEVTYAWNFGDETQGEGSNIEHEYNEETIYTVTLVGENVCGSDTVARAVSTYDIPLASFEVSNEQVCVDSEVSFLNSSTENATSYEWVFPGADTTSSSTKDPVVKYAAPGWYDATLIASNPKGSDTIVIENVIQVVELPVSYYEVQQLSNEVTFTNLSEGIGSYQWLVNEESVSTDSQLVYTFESEDVYTVSLLTSNACGVDTFESEINTFTLPEAGIAIEVAEHCLPGIVDLQSTSSDNAQQFTWILPGSEEEVSDTQNPTATYRQRGVYDVTLIVSNPTGKDTLTLVDAITIRDIPEGSFSYFKNVFDVNFTSDVSDGVEYIWDFGDGQQGAGKEAAHTYSEEGDYVVKLLVSNSCGSAEYTDTITINDLPTASFESVNREVCFGNDIQFTNMSSDNSLSYKWILEGGLPAESTDLAPLVNYAEAGNYDVTLIAYNNSGSDTLTLENYISVRREPDLNYETVINGNEILISNLSSDYTSSFWLVEGEKVEDEMLQYTFDANGIYNIQLTVSNECGIAQEALTVEISAYPEASQPFESTTLCVGEEWILEDVSVSEDDQLLWKFTGPTEISVEGQGSIISFDDAGIYHLEYIVKNKFGSDTVSLDSLINVVHPPEASIDFTVEGPAIILRYDNELGYDINWDVGDGTIYKKDTITHLYSETGTYDIQLEVYNGCGMSVGYESVDIIVDENEDPQWEINLMTFPNPVENYLNISIPLLEGVLNYEILNIRGKLMMSGEISEDLKDSYSLDVSGLMPGHYEIIFHDEDHLVAKKLVKIKM